MVKIIENIDLIERIKDYDLILVGTSIMNKLSNGFQYKVGLSFPNVYHASKTATRYGDERKLGTISIIKGEPSFALCYITKGNFGSKANTDRLEYESLMKCLSLIKKHYSGIKIASTIMGESKYEGNGDREKIKQIFEDCLNDEDVTLFDYIQEDVEIEKKQDWLRVVEKVKTAEYESEKKKYFWKWNMGIYKQMPEDISLKEIKEMIKKKKENQKTFGSFQENI